MTDQSFPTSVVDSGEYEVVHRSAIVRLGVGFGLHVATNHAALGIVDVRIEDGCLVVETDFDDECELTLSATANVDATLALKGVTAGASGGSNITKFLISCSRALPYGTSSVRPAYTKIPPNSAVFDSNIDNLWINLLSLRKVTP